jgi:N-acetylneuraminic acid mutarotase
MPEARTGLAATAYDGNIYAIAGEGLEGVSGSVFRYLTEDDRWERLEDKPTPVRDVEAALIGEKIYVPGGLGGDGQPTDILEIYDPRANQWENGASLPIKLSAYAMTDFEGQLYLFGGWDGEKALDHVFIYDPGVY